jgi:hypothetical protein
MIVLDHYMRACKMHQFFCGAFYDSQIYYNCISFFFSIFSLSLPFSGLGQIA